MAGPIAFSGTYTALVTPFTTDGAVDFPALERLVEEQLAGGVTGLVPCGTTGETPCLSADEQLKVIKAVAAVTKGRAPIIAGTGSNDTAKTVSHSQAALEAGADAVMVVMPYYNKPSQAGMRAHVLAVAEAMDAEVLLYNIPGRSVVDLSAESIEQLCHVSKNVVAVKDATGNVTRCQEVKRRLGDRIKVMSGDDGLTLGMMACGADGVISVSSNVLPHRVSEVTQKMAAGDLAGAREAHLRLLPFHGAMFMEPNPAPAKAGLHLRGKMERTVRLPMVDASEATTTHVKQLLTELGEL